MIPTQDQQTELLPALGRSQGFPTMTREGPEKFSVEHKCVDSDCDHNGDGIGRYAEPCPRCGYHDCDGTCANGEVA